MALAQGRSGQLLRGILDLPQGRAFGVMPGAMLDDGTFGAKLVSIYPDNFDKGGRSHQGVVVLFDGATGAPSAVLEAGEITAIRTAAASAAATGTTAAGADFVARAEGGAADKRRAAGVVVTTSDEPGVTAGSTARTGARTGPGAGFHRAVDDVVGAFGQLVIARGHKCVSTNRLVSPQNRSRGRAFRAAATKVAPVAPRR